MKRLSLVFIAALAAIMFTPALAGERQITVSAKNYAFVPSAITLKVHQHAKLRFVGTQGVHGIIIPEIGVDHVVNMGASPSVVEVTPNKTGNFVARCAVYCGVGHNRMILKVKVVK